MPRAKTNIAYRARNGAGRGREALFKICDPFNDLESLFSSLGHRELQGKAVYGMIGGKCKPSQLRQPFILGTWFSFPIGFP